MQTREEYVKSCKERALKYCDAGQPIEAITSILIDMSKRPDTQSDAVEQMTLGLLMIGQLQTIEAARKHINGFN